MLQAIVYFLLVFGVGFVLGIVRVLALEPRLGQRWSEIAEAPVMLIAIWLSARFVVRRFPAQARSSYIFSGVIALVILLLIEFSVVLSIRGISLGQYFAERDPIAGGVYLLMLGLFAAMPWLVGRSRP
ncbi:MAG: hypothetical protein HKM98_10090 [Gammaproteobacteria bacterium]|nr:hypothetical protein [Gammaproteobacteria bacterium]